MKLLHCFVMLVFSLVVSLQAAPITWNVPGDTNVAQGAISLDELRGSTSFTYQNVNGQGYDLRVSASRLMINSTGDLNYTQPGSSLSFAFFETGTNNPVAVSGFAVDWRDLDAGLFAGGFRVVDGDGDSFLLDTTSSGFFPVVGNALTATDRNNDGVADSFLSSEGGNFDNLNNRFVMDLSSVALHSFTLEDTDDFIAPTSLSVGVDVEPVVAAVPEPGSWCLLGLAVLLVCRRRC